MRKIVTMAYERTIELLTGKRDLVKALAEKLLEKEVRFLGGLVCDARSAFWQGLSRIIDAVPC